MIKRLLYFLLLFFLTKGTYGISSAVEQGSVNSESKVKSIVCVVPLTGKYSAIGNKLLRGALLAKDEYGYLHYKVHAVDVETTDVFSVLSSIKQKEDLLFVIGPAPVKKFKPLYDKLMSLGIPVVAFPIWKEESFRGKNLIKFYYPLDFQVSYLASFVAAKKDVKRLVIVRPNTATGGKLGNMFRRAVMRVGKIVNYEGTYDPVRLDLGSELLWLKVNRPDLIFLPDSASKSSIIIKRILRERVLFNTVFLGLNTWNSKTFEQEIGKSIDGVIANIVFTDFIDKSSKEWLEFFLSFKRGFGYEPDSLEFIAYRVSEILFKISDSPGGDKEFSLIDKLRTVPENEFELRIKVSYSGIEIFPRPMLFTIEDGKIKRIY